MTPAVTTQPRDDYADLMAPDIAIEVRSQFRDAAQEITTPDEDLQKDADVERKEGRGVASFDGSPRPSPHDEFGATVYGREGDARTDAGLMLAVGIAAASSREQEASAYQPAPEPSQAPAGPTDDLAGVVANRPNYAALRQEAEAVVQTTDELAGAEPSRPNYEALRQEHQAASFPTDQANSDLMDPGIRANSAEEFKPAGREATDNADLKDPAIDAEVSRESLQQSRVRGPSLGL